MLRIIIFYRRWYNNLAAKRDFVALKAEVEKLDITKLVNVSIGLNILKTKADDLHVDKFKTVLVDLKKLRYVVSKKVVKNIKFNKLNTKILIRLL